MPSFSDSGSDQASILDFADVDLCSSRANNVTNKTSNGQEDKQVRLRLSLDEICHRTNFTRKEVRAFYRTLKQVSLNHYSQEFLPLTRVNDRE